VTALRCWRRIRDFPGRAIAAIIPADPPGPDSNPERAHTTDIVP
jgi:hypothetical protein